MKNVNYVSEQANSQPSSVKTEPQWVEESVALSDIIRHGPLQVRRKLDAGAVKRYRDMTKAGSYAPPIKIGRVGATLYLVDGWHRLEAGACLVGMDTDTVTALVADMTETQVRWEAAKANMGHGVPLKRGEYRNVYRAYIKAKQHHKKKGVLMSYREMSEVLGIGHTTLRNWTMRDFPTLFRTLGGVEHGNAYAEAPPLEHPSLAEEHAIEARRVLAELGQHSKALESPEARWEIVKGLELVLAELLAAGVKQPEPAMF